jgi:hypothetical protein
VSTSPRGSPLSGSSSHSSHPHHQSLGPDRNVLAEFLEIWDRAGARAQISMTQGRMLFSSRPIAPNSIQRLHTVRCGSSQSPTCASEHSVRNSAQRHHVEPLLHLLMGLLISSAPSHLRRRPVPPSPGFIRDSCFRPNPYSVATRGCRS